ncbi:TPA: hypothetical protein N0F65_011761, partial [Lagenidium giganteum]
VGFATVNAIDCISVLANFRPIADRKTGFGQSQRVVSITESDAEGMIMTTMSADDGEAMAVTTASTTRSTMALDAMDEFTLMEDDMALTQSPFSSMDCFPVNSMAQVEELVKNTSDMDDDALLRELLDGYNLAEIEAIDHAAAEFAENVLLAHPLKPAVTASTATIEEVVEDEVAAPVKNDDSVFIKQETSTDDDSVFIKQEASTDDDDNDDDDDDEESLYAQSSDEEKEPSTDDEQDVEAELLDKEVKYLEAQYEYLRSRASRKQSSKDKAGDAQKRPRTASAEASLATRKSKQQTAESSMNNKLLRQLVSQQQFAMENMRAMLSFAPVNDVRMALMTPLESYIHLGKDFNERRNTILQMKDEKLEVTRKYLDQQSQGLSLELPYRFTDSFERFGKLYLLDYQQIKFDHVTVHGVVEALRTSHQSSDIITKSLGCMTIKESYDDDSESFKHQRIISSMELASEPSVVESNQVYFFGNSEKDNVTVIVGDYIDRDDLHPYESSSRIRKDTSFGYMFQPYKDEKGVQSVVMKRFVLSKYHLHQTRITRSTKDLLLTKMTQIYQRYLDLFIQRVNEQRMAAIAAQLS